METETLAPAETDRWVGSRSFARINASNAAVAALLLSTYEAYNADVYGEEKHNRFLISLAEQIHNAEGRDLSANQLAAAEKFLAPKAEKVTEFAGEVGAKVEVTGTIKVRRSIEGQYGLSFLVIIEVSETVTVKTFTTSEWVWEAREGDTVTLKGTIKANEVYEGTKASLLTRTKAVA